MSTVSFLEQTDSEILCLQHAFSACKWLKVQVQQALFIFRFLLNSFCVCFFFFFVHFLEAPSIARSESQFREDLCAFPRLFHLEKKFLPCVILFRFPVFKKISCHSLMAWNVLVGPTPPPPIISWKGPMKQGLFVLLSILRSVFPSVQAFSWNCIISFL